MPSVFSTLCAGCSDCHCINCTFCSSQRLNVPWVIKNNAIFRDVIVSTCNSVQMDKVPLSQVTGLLSIQQQLGKLSVHRGLHTLRELLIEAVEEKRGSLYGGGQASPTLISPSSSQSWRISATARLTTSRWVS